MGNACSDCFPKSNLHYLARAAILPVIFLVTLPVILSLNLDYIRNPLMRQKDVDPVSH